MKAGKIIINISIIILGIILFILSLESLRATRILEAFFFIFLVVLIILLFFKVNWDYFDTSKDVLALE